MNVDNESDVNNSLTTSQGEIDFEEGSIVSILELTGGHLYRVLYELMCT